MRLFPSTVVSNSELPMMFGVAPNITGDVAAPLGTSAFGQTNGALYTDASKSSFDPSSNSANTAYPKLYLDSSRTSAVFGASDVVQPSSILMLACIKF